MIKNKIKQIIAAIGIASAIPAWSACPLGLTNEGVSPRPMTYMQSAEVTITPYNLYSTTIPASDGFVNLNCN